MNPTEGAREQVAMEALTTLEEMANRCSVPMDLWDRHANAVLALAALAEQPRNEGGAHDQIIRGLQLALWRCQEQFTSYRDQHLAKSPPDTVKAKTNEDMATMCRDVLAIAAAPPPPEPKPQPPEGDEALLAINAMSIARHQRKMGNPEVADVIEALAFRLRSGKEG